MELSIVGGFLFFSFFFCSPFGGIRLFFGLGNHKRISTSCWCWEKKGGKREREGEKGDGAPGGIKTVIIYNYTTHNPFIASCLSLSSTADQELIRVLARRSEISPPPFTLIGGHRHWLYGAVITAISAVLNGTYYPLHLQSKALPITFYCSVCAPPYILSEYTSSSHSSY